MRIASPIILNSDEQSALEKIISSSLSPIRLVCRARVILLAHLGETNKAISALLKISKDTVSSYRKRYLCDGLKGLLKDKPRGNNQGGKNSVEQSKLRDEILRKTTQEKPENSTHWSTRSMAKAVGTTHTFVSRVWKEYGLKPHLIKNFKVSNDPKFEEKLRDVVGLYMDPPEKAIVLCVDEKSSIQALDRTQPGLPMKKGRCGTMTHDYKRNGTSTLFAALDVATGEVIGQCLKRHRHQEFLKFLDTIDANTDKDLDLHIIVDNYGTHKHPKVKTWLKKHKRFHFHFTPTSASWANLVERFFGVITDKQIRRGVFTSVAELESKIYEFIENHNKEPKPFTWTKPTEKIIEKVNRARIAVNNQKAV